MAKFIGYAETKVVGSRCEVEFEVDDEELEGLERGSPEYEAVVQAEFEDAVIDLVETWWEAVDED